MKFGLPWSGRFRTLSINETIEIAPTASSVQRQGGVLVLAAVDDVDIQSDIVTLHRPPQEYFGYNYDCGRLKLRNAIQCLTHRSEQSTETQAIAILTRLFLSQ